MPQSIAPLITGWRFGHRNVPGPFGGGRPPVNFGADHPLGINVYLALVANLAADPASWVWTNITSFVRYTSGITAGTGRADETARVQPGRMALTLDNRDGRFSRRNPTGPYYGQLTRNTPILVTVNPGSGDYNFAEMFVNEWPSRFDPTASDFTVPIRCGGVLRRLAQGSAPSHSPIRRFHEKSTPAPLAYWPIEDQAGSVAAASALSGGTQLTAYGALVESSGVSFAAEFGRTQPAYTGFEILAIGTKPLASFRAGGSLHGVVPPNTSSPMAWTVQFIGRTYAFTGFAGADTTLARWETPGGTFVRWEVRSLSVNGDMQLIGTDATNAESVIASAGFSVQDLFLIRVSAKQDGADVVCYMRITRVTSVSEVGSHSPDTRVGTLTAVATIDVNPNRAVVDNTAISLSGNLLNDLVVGHLGVWGTYSAPVVNATAIDSSSGRVVSTWSGYVGESATARLTRLSIEESFPFAVTGWTFNVPSATMGIQDNSSILNLLRHCEEADGGVLYERRFGLGYQPLAARYNSGVDMTLDFAAGDLANPVPEPTDDDQRLRNSWTVTRSGGSSATVADAASVSSEGLYDDSASLDLYADGQCQEVASWKVHVGTDSEYRWPLISLRFDNARGRALIPTWVGLLFGARLVVNNPPNEVVIDPIDVIIEGKTEVIDLYSWQVALNTTPASVYQVQQVEATGNRGRVDSAGSTLSTDVTAVATSLTIAISDGALWRTGTVNFDLAIGGEQLTVTNISGGTSPQTFTVTRSVNGVVKAQTAGTPVHLWKPNVYAL